MKYVCAMDSLLLISDKLNFTFTIKLLLDIIKVQIRLNYMLMYLFKQISRQWYLSKNEEMDRNQNTK